MSSYSIRYYVYRSNPIILRRLLVPQSTTAEKLLSAFCLGLGIPSTAGEISSDKGETLPASKSLSEIFADRSDFNGQALIYPDAKNREYLSISLRFECCAMVDDDPDRPLIIEGTGMHLPAKVFQISKINSILSYLSSHSSVDAEGIGLFYAQTQSFDLRKTQKLLDTCFAPENIVLLRTDLGFPLKTILENRSMADLKTISTNFRFYHGQTKKAELANSLYERIVEISSQSIFDRMDYPEYMHFKTLVTTGKTDCKDNHELDAFFPILNANGMINITKKTGPQISAKLLLHYEGWYDQAQEAEYLRFKKFCSVLMCCTFLYGVVTKPLFCAVFQALFPGETASEEWIEELSIHPSKFLGGTEYSFINNRPSSNWIVYDPSQFPSDELFFYVDALVQDSSRRYRPNLKDLYLYGQKNPIESLPLNEPLYDFINKNAYTYTNRHDVYTEVLTELRAETPHDRILDRLKLSLWYRGSKEDFQEAAAPLLKSIDDTLPRALFYGHSRHMAQQKQIKSEVMKRAASLKEAAAAKKARALEQAKAERARLNAEKAAQRAAQRAAQKKRSKE